MSDLFTAAARAAESDEDKLLKHLKTLSTKLTGKVLAPAAIEPHLKHAPLSVQFAFILHLAEKIKKKNTS